MQAVSGFNHLETEVLPDRVSNASGEGNGASSNRSSCCRVEVVSCIVLHPINKAHQLERDKDALETEEYPHSDEEQERPLFGAEDTLQEGILIFWILLCEVVNVFFE